MKKTNILPSHGDSRRGGNVSSTTRAKEYSVNVILSNGFIARLTRDEIDNKKDWEEKLW